MGLIPAQGYEAAYKGQGVKDVVAWRETTEGAVVAMVVEEDKGNLVAANSLPDFLRVQRTN